MIKPRGKSSKTFRKNKEIAVSGPKGPQNSNFFYRLSRVKPQIMSKSPSRMIQALGGRKNAQIVTAPKTSKMKPMSLVSLYMSKHRFLRKLLLFIVTHPI